MGCLGVHFAITQDVVTRLESAEDDEALRELIGEIEDAWDEDRICQTDKAWDALHRSLSDGTLVVTAGEHPLNKVIFGGRQLNRSDDYFVVLITPSEVAEVARALPAITQEWLRARYDAIDPSSYQGELSEDDWEYTWGWFEGLPPFFARAAEEQRAVIFTVDQ